MDTLGTKIKLARNARGLAARHVAETLGVNIATVFRWEAGDSKPRPSQLGRLAELLDYPLGYFTATTDAAPPDETTEQLRQEMSRMKREMQQLRKLIQERLSGPGDWRLKNKPPRGQLEDLGQSVYRLREAS